MREITFSVFERGIGSVENLPTLFQEFEQQYGIRVRLELSPVWKAGWSQLVEKALYHSGPDVSEVGDSWVGDLVRMEALRPFKSEEVEEITQGSRYFDAVWQSSTRDEYGTKIVYSIPVAADARVVFFRRDLLAKAGIDEESAFKDFVHFEKTLSCLKEKGISMPLALPTRHSTLTVHYIASWIWGRGGNFLSPDGMSVAFDQPKTLEGCKAYFRLARYLHPETCDLEDDDMEAMFRNGKVAAMPGGFWILSEEMAAEVSKNLAAAPVPGVPFLGGHHLVIWKHSRQDYYATKLIQFLHTEKARKWLYPCSGLPINENSWADPPFNSEIYQVFRVATQRGRSFRPVRLWGLVEKRLVDTLAGIWSEVLKDPQSSPDEIVETHLKGLAQRLRLTLES